MLFTHRGLSGPAILQISSYWREGPIVPRSAAGLDAARLPARPQTRAPESRTAHRSGASICRNAWPSRWRRTLTVTRDRRICRTARCTLSRDNCKPGAITPTGTEGFAKAEVTAGGIDTRDLSSTNHAVHRRSRACSCIGEAVDVTGWLGGYNFQWAWASGWCAGEAA